MAMDEQEIIQERKLHEYMWWLHSQTIEQLIEKIVSLDPTGKEDDDYQDNDK